MIPIANKTVSPFINEELVLIRYEVPNVKNINKLGVNFFDLSSSLESQLGYKDHQKIKKFIQKVNELKN